MKQPIKPTQPVKPTSLLPNILLLPAPHHRKWGWLIWTILIIGLLFGLLWLLRGCRPIAQIAEAETPRAYYGSFTTLEDGPSLSDSESSLRSTSYYHRTMPDGKILFVQTNTYWLSSSKIGAYEYAYRVFSFNPATNQFQESPIKLADKYNLDSYLITQSGQLAVLNLDPVEDRDLGGRDFNVGPGGVNPRLELYDAVTGEKTEIKPTNEDLSDSHFANHPYIFEVNDGILIGAVAYSQLTNGSARQSDAVTFSYSYQTKQLTKTVGSIGLPDWGQATAKTVIPLNNRQALIINGTDLYLFDYNTKTAVFKRRLGGAHQGEIINARLVPNTSLISIITSGSDSGADANSSVYLYNFTNNNLFSYRLGDKPLQQGKPENINSALQGDIPREDTAEVSNQPAKITEDSTKTYWLQPLLDGTVLITGSQYYNLPWSFGLTGILDNQWLARANQADPSSIDPNNNYAEKIVETMSDVSTAIAYGSTIQDSILLPDGRVLFAGRLWFIYTPHQSKTALQTINPTTFAGKLGQVGHWTDGGELLVGDAEAQPSTNADNLDPRMLNPNSPAFSGTAYPLKDGSGFSNGPALSLLDGTPYPLRDGRVFFYKPVYASPRQSDRNHRPIFGSDIIGQLYDSSTGKSRLVKTSALKNLQYPATVAPNSKINSGNDDTVIVDANGNLHIFGYFGLPSAENELVYYPASGRTKLRRAVDVTSNNNASTQLSWMLAGKPVAVGNSIYFFDGKTVFVFDVKTGRYYDLRKRLEATAVKRNPTAGITSEVAKQIESNLPIFNNLGNCIIQTTNTSQCQLEGTLYLGNNRILIANSNQVKIFNYKTVRTETLPNLPNIIHTRKLFRMSDGRVAVVGEATLPKNRTLASGEIKVSNQPLPVIEILNINKATVSEPIESADITYDAWSLPNDRLLFNKTPNSIVSSDGEGASQLALYDLQQQHWLAVPEAVNNLGYDVDKRIVQLPNQPTIIKVASRMDYTDYTKPIVTVSDVVQTNATVLPANAVELFIPETGPWGYYDAQSSHFNWWLWFLTLQLIQGFAGLVIMLTRRQFISRFLIPL